jgi:hypothetical protein
MKWLMISCCLPLAGCLRVEVPNLISDSVKVGKDAYQAAVEKRKPATEQPKPNFALNHSYVGKETQTIGEVKQQCVEEAAKKLHQTVGKEVRFIVTQNDVATINASVVANCRLVAENL